MRFVDQTLWSNRKSKIEHVQKQILSKDPKIVHTKEKLTKDRKIKLDKIIKSSGFKEI